MRYEGLVVQRVEGARRVHEAATWFKQIQASFKHEFLQAMQIHTYLSITVVPYVGSLAKHSVAGAQHVGGQSVENQNSQEEQGAVVRND